MEKWVGVELIYRLMNRWKDGRMDGFLDRWMDE